MADVQRRKCKRCNEGVEHSWKHGSLGGYRYHGCRCGECKQFMRAMGMDRYWVHRDTMLEQKRRQRERNLASHRQRECEKRLKPETAATIERRKARDARVPVTRSGCWMPHEQALVLREDLSILELAYMLQRAPNNVQQQRIYLLRREDVLAKNRTWREQNYPACNDCGQLMPPGRKHRCGKSCANGHLREQHGRRTPGGKVYCLLCKQEYNKTRPPRRQPKRHATCQNCQADFEVKNLRARFCRQSCGDAYRYRIRKEQAA